MVSSNKAIKIATDGSYSPKTNSMGWAWVDQNNNWAYGGAKFGTNQIAELTAILEALKRYHNESKLHIISDSEYAIKSLTLWVESWKKKGWKNSERKIIANYNLIKLLDVILLEREKRFGPGNIIFEWVKGHDGHCLNEKADKLAQNAMRSWENSNGKGYIPKEAVEDLKEKPNFRAVMEQPSLFS